VPTKRRNNTLRIGENIKYTEHNENTHGANFFEVAAVRSEVDELLVEEPGELELQRCVVGDVAGQDDALAHRHVQVSRGAGDGRRLCNTQNTKHTNGDMSASRSEGYVFYSAVWRFLIFFLIGHICPC